MIGDKDYVLNCNTVLDLLEKNELLPSAWLLCRRRASGVVVRAADDSGVVVRAADDSGV